MNGTVLRNALPNAVCATFSRDDKGGSSREGGVRERGGGGEGGGVALMPDRSSQLLLTARNALSATLIFPGREGGEKVEAGESEWSRVLLEREEGDRREWGGGDGWGKREEEVRGGGGRGGGSYEDCRLKSI